MADTQPAKAGFFVRAEKRADADADRVLAAIERWYAEHFHRAAVAHFQPISASEKAALIASVTAATHQE